MIPFLAYTIALLATALVMCIVASLQNFKLSYIVGLTGCPPVMALCGWGLIVTIRKDKPAFQAGSMLQRYYEDSGFLKRVVKVETIGNRLSSVSRWFLNDVSVLWPPYVDAVKDKPVDGLENGQRVKARLVQTFSESPFNRYRQAYLLSWDDCHFIDDDYEKYIKPYRLSFSILTLWGPLMWIFFLGIPFYILEDLQTAALTIVHYTALVFMIPPLLAFLFQIIPLLRNRVIQKRYRKK